ncbi:hypothetical protein DFH27DRAFT_656547 [Peziza echinospora]|nr:hypothetical protein DFH27DRAFT_656547 [Peziza echinospora]
MSPEKEIAVRSKALSDTLSKPRIIVGQPALNAFWRKARSAVIKDRRYIVAVARDVRPKGKSSCVASPGAAWGGEYPRCGFQSTMMCRRPLSATAFPARPHHCRAMKLPGHSGWHRSGSGERANQICTPVVRDPDQQDAWFCGEAPSDVAARRIVGKGGAAAKVTPGHRVGSNGQPGCRPWAMRPSAPPFCTRTSAAGPGWVGEGYARSGAKAPRFETAKAIPDHSRA